MSKKINSTVTTGKCRFSYVWVFEPRKEENGEKYSITLLIPKTDTQTVNKILQAINAVKDANKNIFGDKANIKIPLHDGDGDRPSGGAYGPECKGHYVLTASSKNRPGIVDKNLQAILDPSELYSGCYGRANIGFYAYNKAGSKGIACALNHIQKLEDGEFLGSRTRPEDVFADSEIAEFEFLG